MAIGRVTAIAVVLFCGTTLRAQDEARAVVRAHEEPLTIWVVRPITVADRAVRQTQKDLEDIKQYRESTTGEFGKPASEVGQTAGSYGKTANEVGRPASEVGQTAGSYGQTSGSLPSNVTSQTAGSYGQTAGSFGQSASSYTGAPSTLPGSGVDAQDARRTRLAELLKNWPEWRIRVVDVPGLELRERLAAVEGKDTYPDVLVSDQMPTWWPSAESQLTVRRLADLPPVQAFADEATPARRVPPTRPYAHAYGLVGAAHPETAREFLEWWITGTQFVPWALGQRATPARPEAVAREAVATMLAGGAVEAMADPAMARFSAPATIGALLRFPEGWTPPDLKAEVGVVLTRANSRFAAVELQAICVSRSIFGDLYPLVLLRADSHGDWRVLQITLHMSGADAAAALRALQAYAEQGAETPVSAPVSASPLDGDARAAGSGLRLAWDAEKEDGLLLVEWQLGSEPRAMASSVMLVPNQEGRVHAEATAPFAALYGPVRWRVWALGHGGVVQIGDWRTVQMR